MLQSALQNIKELTMNKIEKCPTCGRNKIKPRASRRTLIHADMRLLEILKSSREARRVSLGALAALAGRVNAQGVPLKMSVQRSMRRLVEFGLIAQTQDGTWRIR